MSDLHIRFGAALGAALVTLTACSGSDAAPRAAVPTASKSLAKEDAATPTATHNPAVPTATIDPTTGRLDYCGEDQAPFTGDAAKKFGAELVMEAYCDMVTLQLDHGFIPEVMRTNASELEKTHFSFPREWMTKDTAKDYDALVKKALKTEGTQSDAIALGGIMLYGLSLSDGWKLVPQDSAHPAVTNMSFSPATTSVEERDGDVPRLGLRFFVNGEFVVTKDGVSKPHAIPFTKDVLFMLEQSHVDPEKEWLIDYWNATWEVGEAEKFRPRP